MPLPRLKGAHLLAIFNSKWQWRAKKHWHHKMTTATEPAGVSKVFSGSPLPLQFNGPCFNGGNGSSIGSGMVLDTTK